MNFTEFSESWENLKMVWIPGINYLLTDAFQAIVIGSTSLLPLDQWIAIYYHKPHWIDTHLNVVIKSFFLHHLGIYLLLDVKHPWQLSQFWALSRFIEFSESHLRKTQIGYTPFGVGGLPPGKILDSPLNAYTLLQFRITFKEIRN